MTTTAPAAPTTEAAPSTGTPAPRPQGDPAPAQQPPAAPSAGDQQGDPNALGDAGKRALQAERDARQKAETDLATLRKQMADANKTAEEKAAEALREAQELATSNAAKALRYEVAAELGVPLAMAGRLVGTTREDIAADAAKLKEILAGTTPPTGGAPAASLDQGARTTAPGQLSREELTKLTPAELLDAAKQGRLNQLLNPKG